MAKKRVKDRIFDNFTNRKLMTQALAQGVHEALLRHKQAVNPVAIWRDGKVVWVKAEELLEDTKSP
ncbi:MAG: hypothetical protein A3K09_01820 [Nitrospinae bacterium RIFCSPLOWO2_12_FULL_47_7]|nr:MAG: hypothetical protein A3K09_01820 [Nitrospinae bacterium RIFCSPLOWO2_12_FULL_47_7]